MGSSVSDFSHPASCVRDLRIVFLTFYHGKFQTRIEVKRIPMCPSSSTDNELPPVNLLGEGFSSVPCAAGCSA